MSGWFEQGHVTMMDPGTIQWCKQEGVLITALNCWSGSVLAWWNSCFVILDPCALGAWQWIVEDVVIVAGG